jgi:hypothetical protein
MITRALTFLSLLAIFLAAVVATYNLVLSLYIIGGVLLVGIGMLVFAWRNRR